MPIYVVVLQDHKEAVTPKIQEQFKAHICLTPSTWLIATNDLLATDIIANRIGLVLNADEEPVPVESAAQAAKVFDGLARRARGRYGWR